MPLSQGLTVTAMRVEVLETEPTVANRPFVNSMTNAVLTRLRVSRRHREFAG
jgi:hypothetical protein